METKAAAAAEQCGNCRYAVVRPVLNSKRTGSVMTCHRMPPYPDAGSWGGLQAGVWPKIRREDWCGEWRGR